MIEITKKFSLTELQSILIFLQFGSSISELIREIEDPKSLLLNPGSKDKFRNMLPRLYTITAEEENKMKEMSRTCGTEILRFLQSCYPE